MMSKVSNLCAGRQAHEIVGIRQGIRFVKIIDSPDQTTFFVPPRAKVFDVEIADRQYFRCGNQLGTDFRPNLYPAIEGRAEERENPLSHEIMLQLQVRPVKRR